MRAKRRRVLQVIAPAPAGGAETVVLHLASGLLARGHDVAICAIGDGATETAFVEAATRRGLEVHRVTTPPRRYLSQVRKLRGVLHRDGFSAVHSHNVHSDVISSLAAAGSPATRTFSTLHGSIPLGFKDVVYALPLRFAYRRCRAVVAVSRGEVEVASGMGVPSARIHLVRNAIPDVEHLSRDAARKALGIPVDGLAVGWIGRLSPEKAPTAFLEAVRRVPIACQAWVIGDGPLRDALAAAAPPNVHMAGAIAGAGRYLKAFDLVVLSSLREGTPIVLLEAMASSVPIVSTRVGGVPDMLTDDQAWLVPSQDVPALAEAIHQALRDPAMRNARAAAASTRARADFSFDDWVARHEALYDDA